MVSSRFISVGANRQPHASDYCRETGRVAFGAGRTVALWDVEQNQIVATLKGHEKVVTGVKYINKDVLVTCSQDGAIIQWQRNSKEEYDLVKTLEDGHGKSVTAFTVYKDTIVSGSADGTVKFWQHKDGNIHLKDTQSISSRFYPLCAAAYELGTGSTVVAVGGSQNQVFVFVGQETFTLEAKLEGHENWVRSLSFTQDNNTGDILLASASQDRYIRLWRYHRGDVDTIQGRTAVETDIAQLLTNKAYYIDNKQYSITFEALIMGHDDWVFSVQWHPAKLQLLSSSADSSVIIWHPDESSGVWVGLTRLGDLSIKGSSTATGSTGGFWNALWIGDGSVTAVGKTGSWRRWSLVNNEWRTVLGVSGNTRETTGISWEEQGRYLLTTSLDQTTRLFAQYQNKHYFEISRPQIHGYDMITVQSITPELFVSGGDEKILRVFQQPKGIAHLLQNVCQVESDHKNDMVDSAVVPVLGLSNKQEQEADNSQDDENDENSQSIFSFLSDLTHPPFEDHLQRLTLWPEVDKLYGHGYEIASLAVSHDKNLIATCCRANSEKHAVVRIYDTQTWQQLPSPLGVHSLTVTGVQFSPDDRFLLTVSRDRTWCLWERSGGNYQLHHHELKGHSRIIWDCSWVDNTSFVTAGRDKTVKLWRLNTEGQWAEVSTTKFSAPVTAVDVLNNKLVAGLDTGLLALLKIENDKISMVEPVPANECPDMRVGKVLWNPVQSSFAVASDDCSVRVYSV